MKANTTNTGRRKASLSVRQLALRWGVGESRIKSLIETGELPAFTLPSAGRFGKTIRIPLASVKAAERDWSVLPSHTASEKRHSVRQPAKRTLHHFPELSGDGSRDPERHEAGQH
jgi:hypothetical protein